MGEWEERTSQPPVAFLVGATSSVALGPTEQAHQGSAFCPLTCDPELVILPPPLSLQPKRWGLPTDANLGVTSLPAPTPTPFGSITCVTLRLMLENDFCFPGQTPGVTEMIYLTDIGSEAQRRYDCLKLHS